MRWSSVPLPAADQPRSTRPSSRWSWPAPKSAWATAAAPSWPGAPRRRGARRRAGRRGEDHQVARGHRLPRGRVPRGGRLRRDAGSAGANRRAGTPAGALDARLPPRGPPAADGGAARELEALRNRLVELQVAFARNINESPDWIEVDREGLDGLPDSYVERLRPGEQPGRIGSAWTTRRSIPSWSAPPTAPIGRRCSARTSTRPRT